MRLIASILFVLACTYSTRGISFQISPDERKCIREEVHKDVLVVGEYKLSEVPNQRTDILVSTPIVHVCNCECKSFLHVLQTDARFQYECMEFLNKAPFFFSCGLELVNKRPSLRCTCVHHVKVDLYPKKLVVIDLFHHKFVMYDGGKKYVN